MTAASIIGLLTLLNVLATVFIPRVWSQRTLCFAGTDKADVAAVSMLFSRQKEYESMKGDQDHLWREILPTKGFIKLNAGEVDGAHVFGIALFHQVRL
jgi:hypothetical protein